MGPNLDDSCKVPAKVLPSKEISVKIRYDGCLALKQKLKAIVSVAAIERLSAKHLAPTSLQQVVDKKPRNGTIVLLKARRKELRKTTYEESLKKKKAGGDGSPDDPGTAAAAKAQANTNSSFSGKSLESNCCKANAIFRECTNSMKCRKFQLKGNNKSARSIEKDKKRQGRQIPEAKRQKLAIAAIETVTASLSAERHSLLPKYGSTTEKIKGKKRLTDADVGPTLAAASSAGTVGDDLISERISEGSKKDEPEIIVVDDDEDNENDGEKSGPDIIVIDDDDEEEEDNDDEESIEALHRLEQQQQMEVERLRMLINGPRMA